MMSYFCHGVLHYSKITALLEILLGRKKRLLSINVFRNKRVVCVAIAIGNFHCAYMLGRQDELVMTHAYPSVKLYLA